MTMPKDPEKFKDWLSKQKPKCQRKWSDPERVKAHWDNLCGKEKPIKQDSPRWVGDDAKYVTVHLYVKTIKPVPGACQICGNPRKERTYKNSGKYKVDRVCCGLELANINGRYNRDPDNYIWLCSVCHKKFDKNKENKSTIL